MEPESPDPLDPDPEIAALLTFEPVVRRTRRHDGWNPQRQRGFIAALARLGDVDRAAHSVGRTGSGAWKVRDSADADGFSDSWDGALDLFHARNPLLSRRGGRAREPWAPPPEPEDDEEEPVYRRRGRAGRRGPRYESTEEELRREGEALLAGLLDHYRKKLRGERECRLAGRIVEADYYVRQLTCIEIALDLGGRADALLDLYRSGDLDVLTTVATPMSLLLDSVRRDYWREKGEPDRFDLPMLGEHDERGATGHASSHEYNSARDGDFNEWRARQDRIAAVQAEAQSRWEKKAKRDARAWAKRVKQAGGGAGDAEEQP